MVAGNVWNAGAVIGPPVTDLAPARPRCGGARLTINDGEIGRGNGGTVMGIR